MAAAPIVQTVFGKTPIQVDAAGIKGSITIPELVSYGKDILRQARASQLDPDRPGDGEAFDKLYIDLWGKFQEFAREFPIVFRWAVHRFVFDERAFRGYLTHEHKATWEDKADMLKSQAEYLVYVRRRTHPDETGPQLEAYRKYIRKHLLDENDTFTAAGKEAEEIHKKKNEERTLHIRQQLQKLAEDARR